MKQKDLEPKRGISRSLFVRGTAKAIASGASQPSLAKEALKAGIRTVINNPQLAYNAAENALRRTGVSAHPAKETVFEPETHDHIEPPENPFASVDRMFQSLFETTKSIGDISTRTDILAYAGKAAYHAHRPEIVHEAIKTIWDQMDPHNFDLNTKAFQALADIERERGEYDLANGLMSTANPYAQWYMDTAVHKGEKWLKGGKEDPTLDPTKDLERARKLLFRAAEPGTEEITSYAQYGEAHGQATGNKDEAQGYLESAQRLFDDALKPFIDFRNPKMNRQQAKKLGEHVTALAKAYSKLGEPMLARWTLSDFVMVAPQSLELSQMQVRVQQQVANDAIQRNTYKDLASAQAAASDAIGVIEAMPDGPEKDELMVTVGVEVKMPLTHPSAYPHPALDDFLKKIEAIDDPLLMALRNINMGKISADPWSPTNTHFNQALDILNSIDRKSLSDQQREDVSGTYQQLLDGYIHYEGVDDFTSSNPLSKILEAMKGLAVGDKNLAAYAKALADVAKAEAIEIRKSELVNKLIAPDATIAGTVVPVWGVIGYHKNNGSIVEKTAADFGLEVEKVEAALAYYEKNKAEIDPWIS